MFLCQRHLQLILTPQQITFISIEEVDKNYQAQSANKTQHGCLNSMNKLLYFSEVATPKRICKTLENMNQKDKSKEKTRINENMFCIPYKGLFAFKHGSGCFLLSILESRINLKYLGEKSSALH